MSHNSGWKRYKREIVRGTKINAPRHFSSAVYRHSNCSTFIHPHNSSTRLSLGSPFKSEENCLHCRRMCESLTCLFCSSLLFFFFTSTRSFRLSPFFTLCSLSPSSSSLHFQMSFLSSLWLSGWDLQSFSQWTDLYFPLSAYSFPPATFCLPPSPPVMSVSMRNPPQRRRSLGPVSPKRIYRNLSVRLRGGESSVAGEVDAPKHLSKSADAVRFLVLSFGATMPYLVGFFIFKGR